MASPSIGGVYSYKMAELPLTANPLADIANTQKIRAVVFEGNLYDRHDLDNLLRGVEQIAASWSGTVKLIWPKFND